MLAVLADELPNEPQLVALQAVDARDAIFCAFYMDLCGLQVELVGMQIDQFGDSQGMSVGEQDQQSVADRVARLTGRRQ